MLPPPGVKYAVRQMVDEYDRKSKIISNICFYLEQNADFLYWTGILLNHVSRRFR